MLPEDVVKFIAPSPAVILSAAVEMYVLNLEAATFLFVPPAPSSMMNRSSSAIPAPISVAPSISKFETEKAPPQHPYKF